MLFRSSLHRFIVSKIEIGKTEVGKRVLHKGKKRRSGKELLRIFGLFGKVNSEMYGMNFIDGY